MKRLQLIYSFVIKAWHYLFGAKPIVIEIPLQEKPSYKIEYTDDVPENIPEKTIFIIQDGNFPELISFKCPCGCNEDILLNVLEDAKPCWDFEIENDRITISPSIWRNKGCKSHFFIRAGNVMWV